jgi:hypothetical protein
MGNVTRFLDLTRAQLVLALVLRPGEFGGNVDHVIPGVVDADEQEQHLALALEHLLNQGINSGNVADQFLWDSVAHHQVVGADRTDPYPTVLTLPDKRFEGRSSARSGEAIINGVPPLGLPKISTWASCIVRPTRFASPLWSIWAKRIRFRLCIPSWRRTNVSSTENGLGLVTIPSTEGGVPGFVGSFMFLTYLLY